MRLINHWLRCLLALSIASFVCALPMLGQEIPTNGNLYGQPVTGTTQPDFGGEYVSTSNGVYQETGWLGTYCESVFKAPKGTKVLHIAWKKITNGPNSPDEQYGALMIQLDDGTVHYFHFSKPPGIVPSMDSTAVFTAPTDSASWKKITGDAIYMLGTLWSQSSPFLYVSRDNLKTWQVDTGGINGAQISDISLDTAQYVYAATDKGLFVQNPDSNVWHAVSSLTQLTNLSRVFVDRENRILAAGSSGGLYMSTNNGTSWSAAPTGLGTNIVGLMADDAYHNLFVSAAPFAFSSSRLYRSAGGTGTWQIVDTSISRIVGSASFQTMNINTITGDSMLIAGTSFGVFMSTDQGLTWTMNNNGIKAENISGIAKTASGKILLATDLGIFSNTPPDTVWTKSYPTSGFQGPPFQLKLYSDGPGNIYTLDSEHYPMFLNNGVSAILKSTDGGTSWAADTLGLSGVNGNLFYVDETGTQHYGGGGQYSSFKPNLWAKPSGGSWTIDTTGFPAQTSNYAVSMTSDRNGFLYVSGNLSGNRVMRRPIAGGTWVVDTAGIPPAVASFGLMVPGKNGDVFGFVGQFYGTGLMRRSAGTWSSVPLPSQLVSPYVTAVSVDNAGVLFAAFVDQNNLGRGVYFSINNGTSWTFTGCDSVHVTSLVSFGDSTYALTSDAGAFYVGKSGTTAVQRTTGGPVSYSLAQNYPNPFNPATTIRFSIAKFSVVNLKIYDLLGREVATLVNGAMNAGVHEATFDASRLASGIYFYRLRAGDFSATKKLVLVK
ncbi:MAG TPA: T9SS type A sorting domain-containing protein [Bacteroidota bacterium]